jgi:hypothetical protein
VLDAWDRGHGFLCADDVGLLLVETARKSGRHDCVKWKPQQRLTLLGFFASGGGVYVFVYVCFGILRAPSGS